MQPEISIIIPVYNCSKTIGSVLKAVYDNNDVDKEVIVIDDISTDNSLDIVKKYPCKIIPLIEKSGPSAARNRGAVEAKSSILMFIDSDAVIEKGSLKRILNLFKENPAIACVSGVFKKNKDHSGLFSKYRDLQLHYWHQSSTGNASVFILTAGAIKKEVFFEVGKFNKKFGKTADIEDFEIGHRISKKHKMVTAKEIKFHHLENASPFFVLIKKLFRRARMWAPLFLKRKKFEKNYATKNRSLAVISAGLAFILFLCSCFLPELFFPAILFLGLFFLLDAGFYVFLFKEGPFSFFLCALLFHLLFSLVLFCGATTGTIETIGKLNFFKKTQQ